MFVTRFAPSPTGRLHLGHVYAAWFAYRAARDSGGKFLLRIEDIDTQRCRPDFDQAIIDDLSWLGLLPDDDIRRQSAHMADYEAVLHDLRARGLLYPCFCSRSDIAREIAASPAAPHAADGTPVYPGLCRRLSPEGAQSRVWCGDLHVWRLNMGRALHELGRTDWRFHDRMMGEVAADPAGFGDIVLGRRDMPCSYHLCVTHDDARQGVNLVTRGRDLVPATAVQMVLQALMGWPTPQYAHHDLRVGEDGKRFAKRDGAVTIDQLRRQGADAAQVLRLALGHDDGRRLIQA